MTYSIIARDPASGEMGVATQSQAFAVGSSVPWAMPGYGVIATQSMGEPMYGELGLDALRAGLTAQEALEALRTVDPHPERRQVAMVDGRGEIGVYTGEDCIAEAGHCVGEGCATVANLMATPTVWVAMIEAFQAATGNLTERLLEALDCAEAHGGDLRGTRSAALLVVRAERSGRPWRDQVVDLRVDDHDDPLGELRRMVEYNRHYHRLVEAFELALDGSPDEAVGRLDDELAAVEEEPDFALWRAIVLALAGRTSDAADQMGRLSAAAPQFVEVARRFRGTGLVPAEVLDRIMADDPP